MARIRSIHPDVHADPKLAKASGDAWRLYFGIANQADDFGVCLDAPERLQLQVFAARPDADAAAMIAELVTLGKLARYVDDATGRRYLHCVDWTDEQRIDKPSTAKRNPSVASMRRADSPDAREDSTPLARAREESRGLAQEGKGEESKGEENTKSLKAADAAESATKSTDASAPTDAMPASRRSRSTSSTSTKPKRTPKGEPAPWMAELAPVWRGVFGGDMPQGSATLLRPLIAQHDVPSVAAHLAVYCRVRGSYGSVRDFVSKFGLYAPGGAEDQRHEREAAKDAARAPLAAAVGDGVTRGPRPGVSVAPLTVWR